MKSIIFKCFVFAFCLFSNMLYSQEYTYSDFLKFKESAEKGDADSQFYLGKCYYTGQGIEKDYDLAFYWFSESAKQGNAKSENALGICYEYGTGIKKDVYKALFWYKKSAEQGYAAAQCNLGSCYKYGEGIEKNYEQAVYWYKKAAEQENIDAQFFLGVCYETGDGVIQNYSKAFYWYKKSAEQGNDVAQCNLGFCYENGNGVTESYIEAIKWYDKSAKQGNTRAQSYLPNVFQKLKELAEIGYSGSQCNLGYCYEYGLGVEKNIYQAVYWYKKSAEQGDDVAQCNLGSCYKNGVGVDKDYNEAFYWFKKSADQGNSRAQFYVGYYYANGLGYLEKDYSKAVYWYKKSAEQGYNYAQCNLGICYYNGEGVEKDYKQAIYWYKKSAEQGNSAAQNNLGYCYKKGEGVEKDYKQAIYWYKKSAEQGNSRAQYNLAKCYENGEGVVKDYEQAVYWYRKSAEQDRASAQNALAYCYAKGKGVKQDFVLAHKWIDKAIANATSMETKLNYYDSKGEIYAIQGDKENALLIWNKIIEEDPNFIENETDLYVEYIRKWISKPALLDFVANSIKLVDENGNGAIDAEEQVKVCFEIENRGEGDAINCIAKIASSGCNQGLTYEDVKISNIKSGETKKIEIPITASMNTIDEKINFKVFVDEPMGFGTETVELMVDTRKFVSPMLKVVDYTVTGSTGSVLEKKRPFDLQLLLQNVEQGDAELVEVNVSFPQGVFVLGGNEKERFNAISAGEAKSLEYSLIVNQNYASEEIPIEVKIKERHGKYAESKTVKLKLNQTLASNKIDVKSKEQQYKNIEIASLTSEVDKNIPVSSVKNNKTFAVIIANENYQNEANVPFALNDGNIFSQYCNQTLGIPTENIHYVADASLNNLKREINWLNGVLKSYKGDAKAIFYYAGHGVPNESNKSAYLLPIDGFGSDFSTGYKLDDLYATLGNVESQGVTIFLDACFSGAKREGDMMTSGRAIAIKVKKNAPVGKMVVFSAAQSDETAYQNNKEKHGMFTYYLLKKLQDSEGNVSYGELEDYIVNNVSQRSIVLNGKSQTPSVVPSQTIVEDWKKWTLK